MKDLDEAIQNELHISENAHDEYARVVALNGGKGRAQMLQETSEYHYQLAEWLKQLKKYKELDDGSNDVIYQLGMKAGREETIDEFKNMTMSLSRDCEAILWGINHKMVQAAEGRKENE